MVLELTSEQKLRLDGIFGDIRGNYGTVRRTGCFKITPKQLIKIKKLYAIGKSVREIANTTKLSQFIVKRAITGFYNHILKQ